MPLCSGWGCHPHKVPQFGHVVLGRGQRGGGRRPGPSAMSNSSQQWWKQGERFFVVFFFLFFFFSNRIKRRERENCWQEEGIGAKPRRAHFWPRARQLGVGWAVREGKWRGSSSILLAFCRKGVASSKDTRCSLQGPLGSGCSLLSHQQASLLWTFA